MLKPDDIESQHLLLAATRRTLAHLLQQAAAHGGLSFAPAATANGIAEARTAIARIKTILREQSVPVDDHPNDLSPEERAVARRRAASDERSPYLGLLTFQETNAEYFFGRDSLIADLVGKAGQAPFLAVLGPSGSGKSSVVRAGLIPALKRGALPGSAEWIYCPPLKPDARPLNNLAALLAGMPGGAALGSVFDLQDRLAAREDALLLAADTLRAGATGARLVLLIDQAEELWTLAPNEREAQANLLSQQRAFIQQILGALRAPNSPLLLLFTMRADFLHRAAEHPELARAISEHLVLVSPMTTDELRLAITQPAEAASASFDPGLVDKLIEQTENRPGALPLLEYTLLELWNNKRPDGTMTWDAFRSLGGVEGALEARADAVFTTHYPAREQQEQVRKILLRLIQPGEGAADTRRRVRLDDLTSGNGTIADVQSLLAPLTDERLLTSGYDASSGAETIEIAHEALIRTWRTFNTWIAEAREDLRLQIQLEDAAREWQHSGENPDFLWGGLRLANAEAWLERVRPGLNPRDKRFLEACRFEELQRQEAEEAARQRELAQERAFAQRLRRRAIYLAVAFVAALIIAAYAFVQRNDAQEQRNLAQVQSNLAQTAAAKAIVEGNLARTAEVKAQLQLDVSESRRLADVSRDQDQLDIASDTDLLLAYEAAAGNDNVQSQQALRDTLLHHVRLVSIYDDHTRAVSSAVFSPDGQHILTTSADKTARLWDANGTPLATLSGHTRAVYSAVFSLDGQHILTASDDHTARLWDANGTLLSTLSGHTGLVSSVVFSPDVQRILTASYDSTARLWDARGNPLATLSGHTGPVSSAVFSPDGQHILTASFDHTARLWGANGMELATFSGHTSVIYSAVFSPDGRRILTASEDHTARLWDTNGELLATLSGHTGRIKIAVFSPNSQRILTVSADKTGRLWDARGTPLSTLSGHTEWVTSAVFSPDGQRILTASYDKTARLWDVRGAQLATLSEHTSPVYSAVFSPDGQHILTASDDKTARLWDARGVQLATLSGHTDRVNGAVFSPDGQRILTASYDSTARLWDARGTPLMTLSGHTDAVYRAVFSPDGQRILTASFDHTARLWGTNGTPLAMLSGHTAPIWEMMFSPDGQHILTAGSDGTARLWNLNGKSLATLSGHTGPVSSAVFSPDGQRILTASDDGTVRLWDANGKSLTTLSGHTDVVYSAVFGPDGQRILTASDDHTARLWDANGTLLSTLSGHTDVVYSAVFSPDGQRILTASDDKTARLWDARGNPLATLSGHADAVYRAVFSPDGQHILTASFDHTARLWGANGTGLATLSGHTSVIRSAVFSPDGRRILTASDDGTARQYLVNVADLLAVAACRVGRDLTKDEIEQFQVPTPLKFDFAHRQCPPAIGR